MIEYVVVYPYAARGPTTRIPLVLKKKPEWMVGMLNLPGGKLNLDETPTQAAVRELKEETGLDEVKEYDPMTYYGLLAPQYLGHIQGTKSIIHCVKVPVDEKQELNPGPTETEEIKWYNLPDLYNLPNLMPNLRVTIPLMSKDIKNWIIYDLDGGWREKDRHKVDLVFDGMSNNPIQIFVRSVKFYEEEE
jgi:8-oxo-dGTP pyrophosphatase MutT (NUDIX family)